MIKMPTATCAMTLSDFRDRYARASQPVVFTDGIEHWPARSSWSLDYFAQHFPSKQLHFSGRQWVLGHLIEQLRAGVRPAPYMKEVKLDEQFAEVSADLGKFKFAQNNLLESRWLPRSMRIDRGVRALFIGSAGGGFGTLHWDFSYLHVFISQICGEKDFVLYHPDEAPNLYPDPEYPNKSSIPDFNDFDPAEFPNVAKATPMRFTLTEGQTVFIPGGWWHATAMRGPSISVAESTLDDGNWALRSSFYLKRYRDAGVSAAKRAAMATYLHAAGLLLR